MQRIINRFDAGLVAVACRLVPPPLVETCPIPELRSFIETQKAVYDRFVTTEASLVVHVFNVLTICASQSQTFWHDLYNMAEELSDNEGDLVALSGIMRDVYKMADRIARTPGNMIACEFTDHGKVDVLTVE